MTVSDKTPDWRDRLVAAHSSLFGADTATGVGTLRTSDGWRDIVDTMLTRITAALNTTAGNFVKVDSVEAKNGSMTVRLGGLVTDAAVRAAVEQAVDLAEARSAFTCEFCGADGRQFETPLGWLITACDDHGRGSSPISRGDHEDLVVRRALDGKIVSCRRYDRAGDRFFDVAPNDVGLEE